ncbi:hypothetical protein ACHAWC_001450 [Mediolabrus comicus]
MMTILRQQQRFRQFNTITITNKQRVSCKNRSDIIGRNNSSQKRSTSTSSSTAASPIIKDPPPTAKQLAIHALKCAIPMIGFGFMDNTIMIHAGHYIDCTLGVTFSLSTLAAAGIGQIFSGIGGVLFGDTLETVFRGTTASNTTQKLSTVQKTMRSARIAGVTGGILGVTLGCTLGLINLFFVDEQKANMLKLQALEDGQEFEFEVEIDNAVNPGLTTVYVRGPDVDGVLASITARIAAHGCSVVKLDAGLRGGGDDDTTTLQNLLSQSPTLVVEDTFIIRNRATGRAVDNDDLDDLARTILAAAKDPLNSHSLKGQIESLEVENIALAERVLLLESYLEDRQIKIVKDEEKEEGK